MDRQIFYYFLAGVFIALGFSDVFAGDINWKNISAEHTGVNCVLIAPDNPREIYAGSGKAVLKSEDSGNSWRVVLNVKKPVNYLVCGSQVNSIYAASGKGLYYSANQGRNWRLIFKISDYPDNEADFVLENSGIVYLGTKKGLLVSEDKGRSWHKYAGKLSDSGIFSIARGQKDRENIYIACEDGFFASYNNGQSWKKIFNGYSFEENENSQDNNDETEKETVSDANYITASENSGYVYVSGKRGIHKSVDCGRQWEMLSDFGLLDRHIKFMLVSADSDLYAVTKTGIYKFTGSRWQELSLGLTSQDIRSIALDGKGSLYAACDKGLFKAVEENFPVIKNNEAYFYYKKEEPDISQIQKAAVKYAEVEPEKIQLWRKQAAKKALLPEISASVDRNTSDLWHWESGSTTKTNDDILIKGNDNIDWGITVSWDLGEIIWNNDQTSIDTRSRLMVQLREDVLDEVTKLYFERIRLKMELDNLSIEDRKKRFEKELKIRELTAMLDGMTGGYFSQPSTSE